MANVFLKKSGGATSDSIALNSAANVFGDVLGQEELVVQPNGASFPTGMVVEQTIEKVTLTGALSDFTFASSGTTDVLVYRSNVLVATIRPQTDDDGAGNGTELAFTSGRVLSTTLNVISATEIRIGGPGGQVLTATAAAFANTITSGPGVDQVTLGAVADTVKVGGAVVGTTEKDTLTFSTTAGNYIAGGKLSATIGGKVIEANVVAGSAADSLAALVTAINASNADTTSAGLNGLLKTTNAAAGGAITLEAATAGVTGFAVTDVKIDKPATAEKDTLSFSSTNADYYTGGKLYATIGGKAIAADMVNGDAAGSQAALVTAVNASNDDTTSAGLNGLLKPTNAAVGGVITLEATTAGATGFAVTDVKIDKTATTEKDTLTFSTTVGNYIAGGKLSATIGGKVIEANVVTGSAADSLAALVTAINASNADTTSAGLNGLLKTTSAASNGVITLEAATAGLTGFDVSSVKLDKPATAEKDALTFSTTNADYYTGGKLYATIGGKAITANMVNGDAAGSQAALVTAINTSNADAAGLNGLLKTTNAAVGGVITLEAATAGTTGFAVTDVKVDAVGVSEIWTLGINSGNVSVAGMWAFGINEAGGAYKNFSGSISGTSGANTNVANLVTAINSANADITRLNGVLKTVGAATLNGNTYTITIEAADPTKNIEVIDAGTGIMPTVGGYSVIATTNTAGHAAGVTNATVTETAGVNASSINATLGVTAGTPAGTINATVVETVGAQAGSTSATIVETAGIDAVTASDSTPTAYDTITGFSLVDDTLDLPETTLLTGTFDATATGVTDLSVASIANGVVTFGGTAAATATVADRVAALLTAMGTGTHSAVFVDGSDSYVVQGDGIAGAAEADILVKLIGVQVSDLSAIIG
jgi:hypothetical protein